MREIYLFHLILNFLFVIPCLGLDGIDPAFGVDNTMKFGQKVDESIAKEANIDSSEVKDKNENEEIKVVDKEVPKKPTKKKFDITEARLSLKKIPDGRPYGVYNSLLKAKSQVLLKQYLTYNTDAWLFNNYDKDDENKQKTHDNTPWINEKNPLEFSQSKLCKRLIKAVIDVSKEDKMFYPYRVFGKILRRGDHTLVSADSNVTGDYTALVFVNEFWRKNYYGELYLYDNNKEIVGGATHRPGRVVVYESTVFRLNRPPAVAFLQGQILFQVQFSKSEARMHQGYEKWLAYIQARSEASKHWHLPDYKLPTGEPFTAPDPEKHKVMEYTTKTDGRKIYVYDNLFPKDLLDHLRNHVLKYGSYYYDDSIDKTSDNVQWIAGFMLKPYLLSPYWKIVKTVAKHATGSDKMFPYDVSINLVRNSDHTRIHGDVGYYGEEEFTCLVYLNPNWKKNYYGETTFFEKNADDTEIVAQVRPRYGRTVIFDGNIPHSARPPSFNFSGARLTFVTKLHKNEYTGRKKNFQEDSRHFHATVGGLEMLDVFASNKGEAYAKRQLFELRKLQEKITYRPDTERGERDEGDEDEEAEGKQGEGAEGEQEERGMQGWGVPPDDAQEKPFFEEEPEDEYSRTLVETLRDVTEESVDGSEKIELAHDQMDAMLDPLMQELGKKIIQVM